MQDHVIDELPGEVAVVPEAMPVETGWADVMTSNGVMHQRAAPCGLADDA